MTAASLALAATAGLTLADTPAAGHGAAVHAVFVQTDSIVANQVVVYDRADDGSLSLAGRYDTGGAGAHLAGAAVDPLASQGSLVYDARHGLLFAVNAGSGSLSVFGVRGDRLTLRQVVTSGGSLPVSVAVHGELVYVLDAGGSGSVAGYRIEDGGVRAIPGSARWLGLVANATPQFLNTPGQVGFTPDGDHLIVTTKANGSSIDVFAVGDDGLLSAAPVVNPSAAPVPFGFTFDAAGRLVDTEAKGSVASTYRVKDNGTLTTIGSVADGQAALCWIAQARGFFYGANAGSGTLSAFRVSGAGIPSLVGANGIAAVTGAGPIDVAATPDGRLVYVEAGGAGAVDGFRVNADGSLTLTGSVTGFGSAGLEGIAVN